MKKRIFSSLLALVMVLSLLPATALAADPCFICGEIEGHLATCPYSDSRLYCE